MKRYAMSRLIEWKNDKNRKPLIVKGARQVGKTWLIKEFGSTNFENTAYVSFENNRNMQILFEGDYDIPRLIEGLELETKETINPNKTLIVFDEVQEVPKALASLKYFNENAPGYFIIAAGSLLGIALHKGVSFPVGKVDFCDIYPLTFREFLEAVGEEGLAGLLEKNDWALISAFSGKFIDLLRKYYFVGGMPEAVAEYAESRNHEKVRRIQELILFAYDRDFSKYAPYNIAQQIRNVWSSIPAQLGRENKRFSPGIVKQGSRLSDYEHALQWMLDYGLIYQVRQVNKPALPLSGYETHAFKIYAHDVGILAAKADLDPQTLLDGNRIFTEYKGSLTEQYVLQEMVACKTRLYYWASDGKAEVDFVFRYGGDIYPLEVKAEENLQSKSLRVYYEKYAPPFALRTSMKNYRDDGWLVNIPLYAIGTDFLQLLRDKE